jgi:hypothetical protein
MLTPLSKNVDIWSTEYLQQLPHGGVAKQVGHNTKHIEQQKATQHNITHAPHFITPILKFLNDIPNT